MKYYDVYALSKDDINKALDEQDDYCLDKQEDYIIEAQEFYDVFDMEE